MLFNKLFKLFLKPYTFSISPYGDKIVTSV